MKLANPLLPARWVFALFLVLSQPIDHLLAQADKSSDGSPAKASLRITALLGQLSKVRNLQQTALSPDGRQIAWVVDTPAGGTEIQLASVAMPANTRQITAAAKPGSCEEGDIAWAPDGKKIAFLSNCISTDQMQIFLADTVSAQTPHQIGQLHGIAQSLEWSPDGRSLGFLYVPGATRRAGALDAMKPPSGVIDEDGIEIQRVAAVDGTTGQLQLLTPDDLHVYEFDWSPDSRQIAYVAARPPGENNWWIAELYTQATVGPQAKAPHAILDPKQRDSALHGLQIAVPRWSPDGKFIALIGGLMSDQGATGGDIYAVAARGGEPRKISRDTHLSAAWIGWRPERQGPIAGMVSKDRNLLVSSIRSGGVEIAELDPATGISRTTSSSLPASIGEGRLDSGISMARDGKIAYIKSSFSQPPEVYVGEPGAPAQPVTHVNDALKTGWGKAESITWNSDASTGKFEVQGWLLYPANYDSAKKYPMIVSVHGGPASAQLPRWPGPGFNATAFSALDYFVFFPNPRGSYGQGEAFTMANRKDFGYGDLHDIVTGVDAVVAKYPVDSTRVGLTGWSYGGFMTMFAVTQTDRFRAAVAGAGISNWQSYYGQNSIDQWMVPYFGDSVYNDPAVYSRSSAINFIRRAKTPTLVVVGDRDGECPAPQSFEFWHALRAQHVPTRLVVYPNEGHRFVSPEHRRDVLERALEWFEQYMPAQP